MPIPTTTVRRPIARTAIVAVLALSAASALASVATARSPSDGFAGSSGEAARTPPGAAAARSAVGPTIPGIDVSHWQGPIEWAKVAEDGKRFVFLKATDGIDYVDPTFADNRAHARANGLAVGAYHFARPDPSAGDARREARFFVRIADPRPGDLLPVLDMETSRGLGQAGVTRWARTWVAKVRQLTGVIPLVYTSPYGWLDRTGDTLALARDGAPLWVAHWGVSSPTLPAKDWAGRGWVVWQHTSTGRVAGIDGNVDLDKLAGARLGRIQIRRLSIAVEGGTGRVTSDPPGLGCAATCARNVDPDATVTLTAVPDDRAHFTGWTGACSGTGLTCTLELRGNRAVGARFVSDIVPPTASVAAPNGLTDPVVVTFDEAVSAVTASNVALSRSGGSGVTVHRACRSASDAAVACDGAHVRSVSLTPDPPLVPGRDYVAEVNPVGVAPTVTDGAGNPAPSSQVPFEANRSVEQSSAAVTKAPAGAWAPVRVAGASDGSYAVSGRAGASIRLRFDGTGVGWIAVTGPNRGRARVLIDGELVRTVDLFAAARSYDVALRFDGLTGGSHVLGIVATGRGRPASTGTLVAVDRLDVLG